MISPVKKKLLNKVLLVDELLDQGFISGRAALDARVHIQACPVDTTRTVLALLDSQVVEQLRIHLKLKHTLRAAMRAVRNA